GDPDRQSLVGSQRQNLGAVATRDVGCVVGRAVVHHEYVRLGQLAVQLFDHRADALFLVPGRYEDERVAHVWRSARRSSSSAAQSCRDRTVSAPNSQTRADGVGTVGGAVNAVWIPRAE